MKILVFVKQVPDTDEVKLDPRTGNLVRDGMKSTINPFDANGVETALELKAANGGSVVAISMGPPQADDVLKKTLAIEKHKTSDLVGGFMLFHHDCLRSESRLHFACR